MNTSFISNMKKFAIYNFLGFIEEIEKYAWAVEILAVVFLTMVAAYAEYLIYQKALPKLARQKSHWQVGILQALHRPLSLFIWFVGLTFAVQLSVGYAEENIALTYLPIMRKLGALIFLIWFFSSFIYEIEKIFLVSKENRLHLDKTTIRAVGQVLRVLVFVGGGFFILQTTLGVGASAILAFAGGGSFIIGWAAKDMLANIFGGFMIFLDRPFVIGDRICCSEKGIEGYVEQIGWRLTCIRTLEKIPVYLPNSFFSSMSVENPSRMTHRRIYATIGIRYCDATKLPKVLEEITFVLKSHKELDQEERTYVNFINFGTASLDILVCAYTTKVDLQEFYKVREDLFFKILAVIEKNEAACAFPITEGKLTVALEKL